MAMAEHDGELAAGTPGALCHYRSHQHCQSLSHTHLKEQILVIAMKGECGLGFKLALFWYEQVETNDAVTVASMTRPKPFHDEVMSDLAVSAATKLQCFRVPSLSSFGEKYLILNFGLFLVL